MSQEINKTTHVPFSNVGISLDEARDRLVVPARIIKDNKATRNLYQRGRQYIDPEVFIDITDIKNGSDPKKPYFIHGENTLMVWTNKDRTKQHDYYLKLGFSLDAETRDILESILTAAPLEQQRIIQEGILDPYSCVVTLSQGVEITNTHDNKDIVMFTSNTPMHAIEFTYGPVENAGWSGYPPQRLTVDGQLYTYEFMTAVIEVPDQLAAAHGIKYGTVLPSELTITRGITLPQDPSSVGQNIQSLINLGVREDYALRKIVNPFISFEPGNLLASDS